MDRVFAGFQIDNDFYVMLFLFLLITVVISTVIVVFVSKIQTLTDILERAKEIDIAKEERLCFLDDALISEKIQNIQLDDELKYLENVREKLQRTEYMVTTLQDQIIFQERDHIDEIQTQKKIYNELKTQYKIVMEQLEKSEEDLFISKRSHEELKDRNIKLYNKNRALRLQFSEQEQEMKKSILMMDEHRGAFKEEFSELASKIFDGNSQELTLG